MRNERERERERVECRARPASPSALPQHQRGNLLSLANNLAAIVQLKASPCASHYTEQALKGISLWASLSSHLLSSPFPALFSFLFSSLFFSLLYFVPLTYRNVEHKRAVTPTSLSLNTAREMIPYTPSDLSCLLRLFVVVAFSFFFLLINTCHGNKTQGEEEGEELFCFGI